MSDIAARAALTRMNLREIALSPLYSGTALAADIAYMAKTDPDEAQTKFLKNRAEHCAAFGLDGRDQDKPFAFAAGLAIIPVTGTLVNRFSWSYGSITGYNFIRAQLRMALADEDVTGIVFDVNSYGGEAAGCFELADEIFAARLEKPSLAVVDSNAYSAGYAIGSAASRMVVIPSAGVGSIGVIAMHIDMSKMLEDWGLKISLIFEGANKADGNPFEALSDDARKNIKAGIHTSYESFVSLVAKQRAVDAKVVRDTQSRGFRADEAMSLGLIDAIASPSEAVQAFLGELSGSTLKLETKEVTMTATTAPAATTEAQANQAAADQARVEERARVTGIINCEHGKANPKLANHFAFNTSMSVADATAALAAAAPEKAAAPAGAPAAAPAAAAPVAAAPAASTRASTENANNFNAAMAGTQNPNVGADGGGDGGEPGAEQMTAGQRAAAAHRMATGSNMGNIAKK
ncbi:putative signal peptide peptidase SppA [compost metagenome]